MVSIEDKESIFRVKHRFVCKERRGHKRGDRRVGDWHEDYNDALKDANDHSDKYPKHEVYVETRQERRALTIVNQE